MSNRLHADLLAVIDAVKIESPSRYSVLGMVRELPEPTPNAELSERTEFSLNVSLLSSDIYDHLYIRPQDRPGPRWSDQIAVRDHLAALSAANCGSGTWEPRWTIREIEDDGRIVVVKNKTCFWTSASEVRVPAGENRPAAKCRLRVAKEQRARLPGFYLAVGDADEEPNDETDDDEPLLRYFWHLTIGAAVPFVAEATSLLNAARIPFRLRVLTDPSAYYRADAGVIYVSRRYQSQIGDPIAGIHSKVALALRREVPLFTTPLADGVGVCELERGGPGFGVSRCQLIARSLWESFARGELDRETRAAALSLAFINDGLDPLRPHLESGSPGEFRFLPQPNGPDATRKRPWSAGAIRSAPQAAITPLEAANRIGASLCQTAHWDRERGLCNWMGRSEAELSEFGLEITPTSSALNGELYNGSAGIALFLAELFHVTGAMEFQRVALAAIAHSMRQLGRMQSGGGASPLSFFRGHLGVAYAAERIGVLTGALDRNPQLESLIDRVCDAGSQPHELDLISGNAGAIPALLALAADHRFESCRAVAIALGEELCQKAGGVGLGRVPEPDDSSGSPEASTPQTGLAYGAAGIGLALLELYGATGRVDFLEAGRGAFDHEDTVFDAGQGNWADGRLASGSLIYERTWCHGAPGIALSRLCAAALDPEYARRHHQMGRIAVSTTLDAIDKDLVHPRYDASLCLGLAGLGEVVLISSQLLGDETYQERAQELGRAMIDRHSASADWPSGVASRGLNPSFMLGLAGIGHWFLRLHDPRGIPPLLLLIPERFQPRSP